MPFTSSQTLRDLAQQIENVPTKVALQHLAHQWEYGPPDFDPVHINVLGTRESRYIDLSFYRQDRSPPQPFTFFVRIRRLSYLQRLALSVRLWYQPGMLTSYVRGWTQEVIRRHVRPNHSQEDQVARNWLSTVDLILTRFAARDQGCWFSLTPQARGIWITAHDRHRRYRFEAVFHKTV